jgi:hypothetical protein
MLLAGCATIFTGTTDTLTFDANVPGVRLSVDGEYKGELPLTVPMSRNFVGGRRFVARFEKEGWATQEFELHREFNMVAILDVTSIPTSGGVDVLTGSLMKFSPTGYHVQMLKQGQHAGSAEFRREVAVYGYALASHLALQKDAARGGGAHLSALASLMCGPDEAAGARLATEWTENATLLVGAGDPHDLLRRLDRVIAATPTLHACRM